MYPFTTLNTVPFSSSQGSSLLSMVLSMGPRGTRGVLHAVEVLINLKD